MALAYSVRDRLVQRWAKTQRTYYEKDQKRAYYLSAEFLLGRALTSNLQALGVEDVYRKVLAEMGIDLSELVEQEPDAGLGNGGLGRLAACLMESLATLGMPGYGYGIRYEFGIFEQAIRNGQQVERADEWLRFGNPGDRVEYVPVSFGGDQLSKVLKDQRGDFTSSGTAPRRSSASPTTHRSPATAPTPSTASASGPPRPASRIDFSSSKRGPSRSAPSNRRTPPRVIRGCLSYPGGN